MHAGSWYCIGLEFNGLMCLENDKFSRGRIRDEENKSQKEEKKLRNEANSKKSYVIFEERRKHMEKHW